MKEPIISDLKDVTKEMIDALEVWLKAVKSDIIWGKYSCPFLNFFGDPCDKRGCPLLFDNLKTACPCYAYGEDATILAFTIICDVWKGYK